MDFSFLLFLFQISFFYIFQVTVIEEAVRYIDELHRALASRLTNTGTANVNRKIYKGIKKYDFVCYHCTKHMRKAQS